MSSDGLRVDRPVEGGEELVFAGILRVRDALARSEARVDDVDLVRQGDEAALCRIIEQHSDLVYGIALRVTGCEADAADVLQEVFIALPDRLRTFRGGHFGAWLKVVACRQALMLLRSERRRDRYRFVPAGAGSLEDRTLLRVDLELALGRLDPLLRAVFLLKEIEGFTHMEIAEAMDISENASQMRLYRARRALRELLSR